MLNNSAAHNSSHASKPAPPAWTEPWARGASQARDLLRDIFATHEPTNEREVRDTLVELTSGARPHVCLPQHSSVLPTSRNRELAVIMLGLKNEALPDVLSALAYCGALNDKEVMDYRVSKLALDTVYDLKPQAGIRLSYALTLLKGENDKRLGLDALYDAEPELFLYRAYELALLNRSSNSLHRAVIRNVNHLIATDKDFSSVPPLEYDWRVEFPEGAVRKVVKLSGIGAPPRLFLREASDIAYVIGGESYKRAARAFGRLSDESFELALVAAAACTTRQMDVGGEFRKILARNAPVFAAAVGLTQASKNY